MTQVQFKIWSCNIIFKKYGNGRTAILLTNANKEKDGSILYPPNTMEIAVATVNLPGIPLNDDQVFIKNYSENEGMLSALISAGVVSEPLGYVKTGFVEVPFCTLLIKPE
jgi:hypothetical protein